MVDGLDRLADIQALREAAQRPPAEVQQMQPPSPQAGLQSLGQQGVDMATGMPVSFSPADAVGQVTNIAGQYAMANPQKTAPFAAALSAFGAGSEAANMIDKRVEVESERENLDAVKNVATSLPDRTRTNMPAMAMPVQEEIQISEAPPQAGLASVMPMQEGGSIENENIEPFVDFLKDEEDFRGEAYIPTPGDRLTIGYGHASANVKPGQTITEEEADTLLRKDIRERLPQIRRKIPNFDSFSEDLQVSLFGAWFRGSLGGSTDTIKLINQGKFKEASKEFLDHDEYRNAVARGRPGIRPRMEAVSKELKNYSSNLEKDNTLDKIRETNLAKTASDLEKARELDTQAVANQEQFIKGISDILGLNNSYTVKSGDTLSRIAAESNLSLSDLVAANPKITDPNMIKVGQEINIPDAPQDADFISSIDSAVTRAEQASTKLRKGGDVGEYFEGQVEGKGDGMSDEIPFRVEGGNPDFALLSKDEYVIPADVVSMLGNGSSDAGADELDDFLKDVRKEAFGREKQQTQIDAEKGLSSLS